MDKFICKRPRIHVDESSTSAPVPPPTVAVTTRVASCSHTNTTNPGQKLTGKGRSFQKSWLNKYTWLQYDASIDRVFCKICREAEAKGLLQFCSKKEDSFVSVGFSNWKKALEKFHSHDHTQVHKESIMKLSVLSNTTVAAQLNEQSKNNMMEASLALEAIFTSLKFLCRQGLAIRGHDDVNSNVFQLLELRKEDIPELKKWLGRAGYKWTSHDIQNEIIDVLGQSVLRSVLANIKSSEHFSIMIDETCDVSIREQVSFCVRTVNDDLIINEDFIGLYETPNTESQTLFNIVKDVFARLDLSTENLRGQCYDGASNMSGKFKGLQQLVLGLQAKALYVHCSAHSLNLAVQDSLRFLSCMRDIMTLAKNLINTVRESPKRMEMFRAISCASDNDNDQAGLRPLCPTRWTMRAVTVQQILKKYENLLEFFETFSSQDTTEAGYKCAGYLESMLQFKTYFFLNLYCHVMNPVEEVNRKIQCPHLSVTEMEGLFKGLICILKERRDGFEHFWQLCLEKKSSQVDEPELPRNRRILKRLENKDASASHDFNTPKEYFKVTYNEVCDTVSCYVTNRFESAGLSKVLAVEKECLLIVNKSETSFVNSKEFFKNDLDTDRLYLHLTMLCDIAKQRNLTLNSMTDVRKYLLQESSVKDMLPELVKCMKLLQTVPVTSATAERSFSALRRLKTYLRATMGQKRLNNLAILNAHHDHLDEMDVRPVINEFIKSNSVRRSTFALF